MNGHKDCKCAIVGKTQIDRLMLKYLGMVGGALTAGLALSESIDAWMESRTDRRHHGRGEAVSFWKTALCRWCCAVNFCNAFKCSKCGLRRWR